MKSPKSYDGITIDESGSISVDWERKGAEFGLSEEDLLVFEQTVGILIAGLSRHCDLLLLAGPDVVVGAEGSPLLREALQAEGEVTTDLVPSDLDLDDPPERAVCTPEILAGLLTQENLGGWNEDAALVACHVWSQTMQQVVELLGEDAPEDPPFVSFETSVEIEGEPNPFDVNVIVSQVQADLGWLPDARATASGLTVRNPEEPLPPLRPTGRHWLWVAQHMYIHDLDGAIRQELNPRYSHPPGDWWTCHEKTTAGDLILIYRSKREQGVVAIVQATTDAYRIDDDPYAAEMGWGWGCDYQAVCLFEDRIPLAELKARDDLELFPPLRANFMQRVYKVTPDYWEVLVGLAAARNPHDAVLPELLKQ